MKMRTCAVAGMFYPREPSHLEQLLEKFFSGTAPEGGNPLGIVSPHAGYIYSGQVAAHAFSSIVPDFSGTFVVIGPSHRGYINCVSEIPWETPFGVIDTDTEFVQALSIETDEISHRDEHSIEVQMPFIKYRFPRARIAPVMMGQQDYPSAMRLAEKILAAVRRTNREIRIVASSDFSHYVPESKAKADDLWAIEPLLALDTKEFYRRIEERRVTACGFGPISAMVAACGRLGAKAAKLIRYSTSGDTTGDYREVVGYAAIAVI
ncbi:MAG: AmmeMemoRadiSam system protein B [Methanoregula sp.]|uniref:AmmeMemoRadiSam system protein B n=1 Tax=Methanoregula sp. TaxID=2052170 RepID=UPI003D149AED